MYRPVTRKDRMPAVAGCLVLGIITAVAGCSGEDPRKAELTDLGDLRGCVSRVESVATQHEREPFQNNFVEGAAPPESERSKYGPPLMFQLSGDPEIDGDTAKFTVKVLRRPDDPDDYDNELVAEMEWTAQKVEGRWKLKTAPLPQ